MLEATPRDLRWLRSEQEREMGWYDLSDAEFARDRALRLHCLEELQPPSAHLTWPQSRPNRRRDCCSRDYQARRGPTRRDTRFCSGCVAGQTAPPAS